MKTPARLALIAAGIFFFVYFSNVTLGAVVGKPILNDIQEMLTLLVSAVLFAIGVLYIEAVAQQDDSTPD